GRTFEQDFIADAVALAKAAGVPVQVIWTREDDTQHDFYRPIALHQMEAGLDAHGKLLAWKHKIVSQSIMARVFPDRVKDGIDATTVEGAFNQPYDAVACEVRAVHVDPGVPVGFWRSVGSSHNAFAVECFIDEVAHAAGQDPYHYRRALLQHAPRHLAALDLAAKHAGWGTPVRHGRYRGIAVAESFGSFVAEVAEISVRDGQPHVERVVVGVDCGPIVNPDIIHQQMEGGVVFGLTAAYYGAITIQNGRVQQTNFNDYPMIRMKDAPLVEAYIVPSTEKMGGIGEVAVPPIAPAVANAFFAATGKRVREMPFMS
ncbi:MAG: xanthine dehydrogenase family protein molybdopterin-binding subunit, partial [Candidatus Xenobia bacterium]